MTPQKIKQYSISLCLLALNFSCVQIPNFFLWEERLPRAGAMVWSHLNKRSRRMDFLQN